MIDTIISSIKGEITEKLTGDLGVPANNVDDTLSVAKDSIFDTLKGEASGGNLSGIMNMISGGGNISNNPLVTGMVSNMVGGLTSKLGFDSSKASSIATFIIPFIMQKFSNKAQEDNMDEGDISKMLMGGLMGNMKDKLGGALGGIFGK